MACCGGTVTWYHCYPETCPSSDFCCCDFQCQGCCQNNTCGGAQWTGPCNAPCTSTCGQGACCTCNQTQLGFAFPANGSFGNCTGIGCGSVLWFADANCAHTAAGTRRDTNGTPSNLADLSPALFEALGHQLTEGVFTAGADSSNSGSYTCACP